MDLNNLVNLNIILHVIEACLILFSLFWAKMENSRIMQMLPFKIIALVTLSLTLLGGFALWIFDIVLFFKGA